MSRNDGSIRPIVVIFTAIFTMLMGGALIAVLIGLLVLGDPLSTTATVGLASVSALGFAVLTIGACRLVRRFAIEGVGGDDDGGGRGGPDGRDPRWPPSDEPDWWPEFERDLRAYLEAHERVPATG